MTSKRKRTPLGYIELACYLEALAVNFTLHPPYNTLIWFGLMMLGLATAWINVKTTPEEEKSSDG